MFIRQAEADLLAAQEHYQRQCEKDAAGFPKNFAFVCYLCHECVEKALKGILLCKTGLDPKRTAERKLQALLHASDYVDRHSKDLIDFVLLLNDEDATKARVPAADSASEPASSYMRHQAIIALEGAEGVQNIARQIFLTI